MPISLMIKAIGVIDMSQDIIYGKFEYKDKEYPFFLSKHIITVTQSPGEFNDDFIGESHFDHLVGVTHNGKYITFLDCDIVGGELIEISSNLILVCKGYVQPQRYQSRCGGMAKHQRCCFAGCSHERRICRLSHPGKHKHPVRRAKCGPKKYTG